MLKHSDLFDELPESYHDSAYLDRLHFYNPGGRSTPSAVRCSPPATDSSWITSPRS
nr:BREX system Lon protease-like protein BrxL [Mycobacterium sp. 141]